MSRSHVRRIELMYRKTPGGAIMITYRTVWYSRVAWAKAHYSPVAAVIAADYVDSVRRHNLASGFVSRRALMGGHD